MRKKELKLLIPTIIIILGWICKLTGHIKAFDIMMIIASIILGYEVAKSAFTSLRYGVISINLLVFIAALGGLYLKEYWESAAVTFLFVFGSYLEARALGKTRDALASLIKVAPTKANLIRDNKIIEVDIDEVQVGDVVVVRPGEKIPIDGIVIKGQGAVDEATITGESMPRLKEPGDKVYSTTINTEGYLEVETKNVGEDTLFSKIIYMVEQAQERKANTQRFIESFSRYYTPGIILLSIITLLITRDLRLAITFLVIACPGALVISTPVSIVSAIGNAAKNGIIVKGGSSLEKAGKVNIVAFDKTGTLTKGKPRVYKVHGFTKDENEILAIAASCEAYSEHPLAKAITKKAAQENINTVKPDYFEVVVGQGVKAEFNNQNYYVGSTRLIKNQGIKISQDIEDYIIKEEKRGYTLVLIANDIEVTGAFSIRDEIKKEAVNVIEHLNKVGIKTYMLTGDNERVAAAVSRELGLDGYFAQLLPDDKLRIIENLKNQGKVAMVGDGVNDAPSLAGADMGIAVKGATDITAETADMMIMSDNLEKIAYAVKLAKATLNNLRMNIGFSIFVVIALLLGVIRGDIFLASGMFFHEVSVILVVLNGMRLMGVNAKSLR
ncbi:MAG: heavy metal translocating P-type ATPase [Tepidanaerobacteraceae bacterium]|jgi:Cd2+/Zn2+-exporting ATPase